MIAFILLFENSKTLTKDSLHFKLKFYFPFIKLIGKLSAGHQKVTKTIFHFFRFEKPAMESITVDSVDLHSRWRRMATNLIVVVQESNILDQNAMVELFSNFGRFPQFDQTVHQNNKLAQLIDMAVMQIRN